MMPLTERLCFLAILIISLVAADEEDEEVQDLEDKILRKANEEDAKDHVASQCKGRIMELSFTSLVNFGLYVLGLLLVVTANIYTAWRRRCKRQMQEGMSRFVSSIRSAESLSGAGANAGKERTELPDVPWASNHSQPSRSAKSGDDEEGTNKESYLHRMGF